MNLTMIIILSQQSQKNLKNNVLVYEETLKNA